MEVILLERVGKLGQMGDVVRVKDGFARNFLLPKGKALRATEENRSRFENMKVDLEARNLEQKGEAEKVAQKLNGQGFSVLRQAAEGGQLYGSVSPRDLADLVSGQGFAITRAQIALNTPIKTIGLHKVPISLHPEIEVTINVTVARNADEGERLARTSPSPATKPKKPPRRPRQRRKPSSSPRWWKLAARRKPPQMQAMQKRSRRISH
jgi:large subunit ribosomal protein L9